MRAAGIGSNVTETEQVQVRAVTGHGSQTRDVLASLVIVEGVEQAAIENRVERLPQRVEVQRIGDHELSVQAAIRGLLARNRQCGLGNVNSYDV